MPFGIHERAARAITLPVMFAALFAASAQAHSQSTPLTTPTSTESGAIPASVFSDLLQTQPAENQPYQLGRGDAISVVVEGRPELSSKQIVGPDGSITMPLVGSIVLVDKTRDQASEAIRQSLLKYYTFPVVTVTVEGYNSNRVLLLGSISTPGMQVFDHTPTLLEVLARGGGATHGGLNSRSGGGYGGNSGGGSSDPMPDKAIIYRSNETAITLEVRKLIASGSPLANIRLKRDDVVFIPSSTDRFVSVLGQVQRPGSQMLEQQTTLARILSDAGGLLPQAGKDPKIRIISATTGKEQDVLFKDVLSPRTSEVKLEAGDIIYIPQSGFNSVTYTIERLSPLATIFTTAALLNQH
ncbi:MAG: polysaccharide export protein [Acidobacteriaceae bacterium]|nr:polysaccharide export protein [Acidobacteriaceae bacterium]